MKVGMKNLYILALSGIQQGNDLPRAQHYVEWNHALNPNLVNPKAYYFSSLLSCFLQAVSDARAGI